jgi:two-component system nitrogen regulation response regulator GlnG
MELSRDDASEAERMDDPPSVSDDDWLQLARLVESGIKSNTREIYHQAVDHLDRVILSLALAQTAGNQAQAAELLGLSRPTLRAKLRKLQLIVQKSVTSSVRK